MEPAKKKQRCSVEINRTELVMYMAWRMCWFRTGPATVPVGQLFHTMGNTVRFMEMETDACLPDIDQFLEILDILCQKDVLRIREDQNGEACVFLASDKVGKDIENSILKAQFGGKKKTTTRYKITEAIRILHDTTPMSRSN